MPGLILTASAPLVTRLVQRLPEIATQMLEGAVDALPIADALPDGYFAEDMTPAIVATGAAFVNAVEDGRPLTQTEVAQLVIPLVEQHAEDGIPLSALLTAVHGGSQSIWRLAVSEANAEDTADLGALGALLADLLRDFTVVATEVYADIQPSMFTAGREAHRMVCSGLLNREPIDALAQSAGLPLVERYSVLALVAGALDEPVTPGDLLVARRRQRLTYRLLDERLGSVVLTTFDGRRGHVLIPVDEAPGVRTLEPVFAELADRFEVPVHIGECRQVDRAAIPPAAEEATEVALLARRLGRPIGVYAVDDLLLEFQVTRPGRARDLLRERLEPLAGQQHLLDTLVTHIRHGADRKAAAAELFVHPNTFSYRLRRIAELTGVDPNTPDGSRLLAAALIIMRTTDPAAPTP